MTGKGILEALSFVDEKYIEEAGTGTFRRATPIVRVLLPLAACLCLAFLGLMNRPTTETAPAEQEAQVGMPEIIVRDESDSFLSGGEDIAPELDASEVLENCEVPSVILRIVQWTEDGFTATVEEIVDTDIFPEGTLLNVEIMPNICIETYSDNLVTVQQRVPEETEFPAGTLVRVQFQRTEEENTIRIELITREEESQ